MDDSYWQIYLQFEKELKEIMYTISFDKKQKNVYSPRIAELIVRIGMQIESVAQRIYAREKTDGGKVNYRTAIKLFNKKWNLREKGIVIITDNIKSTDKQLYLTPFKNETYKESYICDKIYYASKDAPTEFKGNIPTEERVKAYQWENAYNNLKHNFYESIERYGTVINLITIASVLYILDVYWSPNSFVLEMGTNMNRGGKLDDFCNKSSVFAVFGLECVIYNEKFVPVLPPWGKDLSFDWFSFLDIHNFESVKNELKVEYELNMDDKKYETPSNVAKIIERAKPYKNYRLIIRNQIKESDLTPIEE